MADFGLAYEAQSLRGYANLQKRLSALGKVEATVMRDLATASVREQRKLLYTEAVQRKTGHSGQLITLGSSNEDHAETVAKGTAVWADTGTRPHIIAPKARKALRWARSSSKGFRLTGVPRAGSVVAWAFATVVHHPGTKAHPYMVRGAQKAIKAAGLDSFVTAWNRSA